MAAFEEMDDVFRALADPSRRRLLDRLNARNGQTLRDLCAGLDMARQSVSKHLAVLEAANLVTSVRRGREKLHYLNAAPINQIGERWIASYERDRIEALADLKRALEDTTAVDQPTFVYSTYIHTTPEQLWQALTEPAFTRRYWGVTFDTDWEPGSTMTWHQRGTASDDPEQVVLESDPPRRLSYTWHTMTDELAASLDITDDARERIAAEKRSRVTFDIEPLGEVVKLTVVHDGFESGSLMASMVSQGWPSVLSNLKTLLETGETLPKTTEPVPPARLGLTKEGV
ncbi:MAG TPA: metalloregulator ArsR/SmtB family transcription factor [Thermoleophilaceae bacterium]|jgi:uncharacterized protein YndB with AHSA1/START domain|nr:metalloregulator ArsR/SmtB family transcription factor [Thermoleophilaceae bacterium]